MDLTQKIDNLRNLLVRDRLDRYRELFQESPNTHNKSWLVRRYRGRHYHVVVLEDGFLYEGVAKHITGTNWNGFRFFGTDQEASS